MKVNTPEDFGDLAGAACGSQHLQLPNEVIDELGETIHGLRNLDESVRTFIVQPLHPRGNGQRRHEKPPRGLGLGPAPSGSQLEDREPFNRRVVRSALRWEALHPGVLDADLLMEERQLGSQTLVLGAQPHLGVEGALEVATGGRRGDSRHRHRLEYRGADEAGPVPR
jgi:hypothetical protein